MEPVLTLGAEWNSSHQCTSWPFCPLDGLRFFIRHKMGFITLLFSLQSTVLSFLFFSFCFAAVFPLTWPDLPPRYPGHFPTFLSTAPTLVPYLSSLTDIASLITSYLIDLSTVLTTYPTNLVTLLITDPTNLTIVLTTYPSDLATLHTQPLYWHKNFTNLVTLIR
jgi:hypothetical protein